MSDLGSTLYWLRLLQLLLAIPLLAIAGQGALWLLTRVFSQPAEQNVFYRLLKLIASPAVRLCRWITPRFVADAQLPVVAFCLLCVGYVVVMFQIAEACHRAGLPVAACLGAR